MLRKTLALLLAAILALGLLTACFAEETPKETGKLVFYAAWSQDRVDPLVQGFTELTGIEVEVVAGGTSELISRIVAEKDNPLGDILWGGTCTSYIPIEEYLESYKTTELDAIQPSGIDDDYKWYGFSVEPMLVVYNTKLVTGDDIPTGWKDLVDPKWKGQIAVVDPTKSSAAFGTMMAIITAYGKDDGKGLDFIREIIKNTDGNILSSSSLSYKGVADGEFMIGLTGEESALKYIADGADLGMVYPEEGTDAIVSPIAIIKDGPNPRSAQLFIDYMLSQQVQSQLAGWGIRSIRTDIDNAADFTALSDINLLDMDNEWIVAHGDEFKDFWKETVTE